MREISSPLAGFSSPFGPQRGFNPSRLFANDEPGVWFEANDSTTLFTDVAGTTPVTAPGDAVALQLDKSQGLTLGPELVTNGGFDTDTDWAKETGWTISGGAASYSGGGGPRLSQEIALNSESLYEIKFDLTVTSGSIRFQLSESANNDSNAVFSSTLIETQSVSSFLVAGSTSAFITIRPMVPSTVVSVDNISVRELPGNHRTQATTAARPLYALHPVGGVRNLLEYTEEFDNAYWVKTNATVTANAAVAPDGTTTADTINDPTTSYGTIARRVVYSPSSTASLYVKKDAIGRATRFPALRISYSVPSSQFYDIFFDTSTGEYTLSSGASGNVIDEGDYWRVWVSGTDTGSNTTLTYILFPAVGASSTWTPSPTATGSIVAWGAQLEEGSTATNYQRVGSFLDVSEEGKARRGRIWYNGTSHFMQTGTITPGTDKVQVFAGVRKLSDAASGVISEWTPNAGGFSGIYSLTAPASTGGLDTARFTSRGTASFSSVNTSVEAAPTSFVLGGIADISADITTIRVNGLGFSTTDVDQGSGNYREDVCYFGARGGTTLFFNGYEDTSIIRFGPNLDATTISKVESYVASKTPEPTL